MLLLALITPVWFGAFLWTSSAEPGSPLEVSRELNARGWICFGALIVLIAGIVVQRPKHPAAWWSICVLLGTYMIRPIAVATDTMEDLNGWVVFANVSILIIAQVAVLAFFVRNRKLKWDAGSISELMMLTIGAAIFEIHLVVIPFYEILSDLLPIYVGLGVIGPLGFTATAALFGILVFVDDQKGTASRLIFTAYGSYLLLDGFASVTAVQPGTINPALMDSYIPMSILFAAASWHPSMHLMGEPSGRTRADWSPLRSVVVGLSILAVPATLSIGNTPSLSEHWMVLAGAVALAALVVTRARRAVGQAVESERRYAELATTDSLTGLRNRRGLIELVKDMSAHPFAVAFLDVDRFKAANDTRGHPYGDAVLQAVGDRLSTLTEIGVAGRVGGDEFAIVMPSKPATDGDIEASNSTSKKLEAALRQQFGQPIIVEGEPAMVQLSVGVALPQQGESPASFPDQFLEMLRRADIAQYYAKQLGGDSLAVYDMRLDQMRTRQEKITEAVTQLQPDNLHLAYQAITDLSNDRTVGAEALARMTLPDLGNVPPGEFVAAAEESGQVVALADWVFDTALSELTACRRVLGPSFVLSINMSPLQLADIDWVTRMVVYANDNSDILNGITLEVTETALMGEAAIKQLVRLSQAGYRTAIDDFGSQFASFGRLQQLAVDSLKLDRSMITDITQGGPAMSVVHHVLALARDLDIKVIAEGVETREQAICLRDMGCRFAQGFLWGRPGPGLARLGSDPPAV